MTAEPYYLTQDGYNQLKEEYRKLTKEEKPVLLNQVKEARGKGNLEDNPEYENVRDQQMMLEGRILEIEQILENAKVISSEAHISAAITIGATVTVEIEGSHEIYQIVGSAEADPGSGKISYESPVGKALLGLKPGDTVSVSLPHAAITYKVVKIHSKDK